MADTELEKVYRERAEEQAAQRRLSERKLNQEWKQSYESDVARSRKTEASRSVMQTTDRIITGHAGLDVHVIRAPQHLEDIPAWTDGKDVFVNQKMLEDMLHGPKADLANFVRVFFGTNYHEVAHILFTPRQESPFVRRIKHEIEVGNYRNQLFTDWNILEDQRIETLYTTMYAGTTSYFVHSSLQWLLKDVDNYERAYPLVYGRKYLPIDVRVKCRDAFVKKHSLKLAEDMEDIIDEYRKCLFPADADKAFKLVVRFYDLLNKNEQGMNHNTIPDQHCKANSGIAATTICNGEPDTAAEQEASDKVQNNDVEDEKEFKKAVKDEEKKDSKKSESGDGESGDGDDDAEDEGAAAPAEGKSKKSGAGESKGAKGKGESEPTAPTNESSEGAGEGISEPPPVDENTDAQLREVIRQVLEEALDDNLSDEAMKDDINNTVKSIKSKANGQQTTKASYGRRSLDNATPEILGQSNSIMRQLQALKFDLEPAWLRGEQTGRINVRRALGRLVDPTILDVFDRWDEGNEDAASVEVVIILDLSGSMGGILAECSKALWMLKRAFDRSDIRTTVLGFSEGCVALFRPEEKVQNGQVPIFQTWGGTTPDDAIQQSYNILSASDAANRIFIAITDGVWGGNHTQNHNIIRSMKTQGMTTMLFYIEKSASYRSHVPAVTQAHECEIAMKIADISEMVNVTKAFVASAVKKASLR